MKALELFDGHIDVHRQRRSAGKLGLPGLELRAGLAQNPGSQGNDQAGVFRDGNESRRLDQAVLRVAPAHQRLEAHHRAGAQIYFGLIKRNHLIMFQRLIQIDGHGHAGMGALAQLRVEYFALVAAALARIEHGHAGVAQQFGGDGLRAGAEGNPGAAADGNRRIFQTEGPRERGQESLGERLRLPHQRGVQQDRELVGSHARQQRRRVDGGFRDHAAEAGRGFDQHLIADVVAQIVVQVLKAIEVEQQNRHGFPGAVPRERVFEMAQKHGAVAESGERIEQAAFAIGLRAQELRLNARVHHRQVDRLRRRNRWRPGRTHRRWLRCLRPRPP